MILERLPFEAFYFNVKWEITPILAKLLNPYMGYFYRCGTTYLQLDFPEQDHVVIVMAIGKGRHWARAIIKLALDNNLKKISFYTSEKNNIAQRIGFYYGFELKGIEPDLYDGEDGHYYVLNMDDYKDSKRYKK